MLKRLKNSLFPAQVQTILANAKVDTEHTQVVFVQLNLLVKKCSNEKDIENIIAYLQKYMVSKNKVLRLKAFITSHYLLRKTKHHKLLHLLSQQTLKHKTKTTLQTVTKIQEFKDFFQSYIIEPYQYYLNKLSSNIEAYQYAKQMNIGSTNSLQFVNKGFQILNLMGIILKTQQVMNKVGRYYPKYKEMLSLFVVYLDDLSVFNSFLKTVSKKAVESALKCQNPQFIKHLYLFLLQSQKISDQLYQYFYNRYFYKDLKDFFFFPTFLTTKAEDFKQIKKKVKTLDKAFFQEMAQQQKGRRNMTEYARPNLQKTFNSGYTLSQCSDISSNFNRTSHQIGKYSSLFDILQ